MADMSVNICGVPFSNPVIAASGTFGFGREYQQLFDVSLLGGIAVKGLTRAPRQGNPAPRVAETPSGMLNSVGLQNPGVEAFIADDLPWLRSQGGVIIANMAGACEADYVYMADRLSHSDVDMLEMNISCPNVKEGGLAFGARPELIYSIVRRTKPAAAKPLIVKLSPNVADIAECAKAAEEAGADAISLINTLTGMALDVYTRRPVMANIVGGLSGPAIRPVALRMVWQAARAVKLPVIGMGGIMTGEDAAAFMLCGASAVMVGTATIHNPMACLDIINQLEEYCDNTGVAAVSELVGALRV